MREAVGGMDAINYAPRSDHALPSNDNGSYLSAYSAARHSLKIIMLKASSGSQNITFDFSEQFLRQKVDRFYHYADYWIWQFPNVKPAIHYSMVLQAGSDGWACFTRGQNNFFSADPSAALGYADPILTDYLIITSQTFAVPKMVVYFNSENASLIASTMTDPLTNVTLPTLTDPVSSITLVFNATSYAPYMVRTFEEHAIFGNSTSDVLLVVMRDPDTVMHVTLA
jgi:hypothetical protein